MWGKGDKLAKESDIRPKGYETIYNSLRDEEIDQLLEEAQFVYVPCVACGSTNLEPRFVKNRFTFQECLQCSTLLVNPRPSASDLAHWYRTSESIRYFTKKVLLPTERIRSHDIFLPRVSLLLGLLEEAGYRKEDKEVMLLDVGCAIGTFLQLLKSLTAFRLVGIDPDGESADECMRRGIAVLHSTFEEADWGGEKVDVITCFELLEHLFEPRMLLRKAKSCLKTGGLLILTTPNSYGFDFAMLGSKYANIAAPNHLNYFNPGSLSLLLESEGFRVRKLETPGILDVDIVRNNWKDVEDTLRIPFFERILIEEGKFAEGRRKAFQDFLSKYGLSGHMLVVAGNGSSTYNR